MGWPISISIDLCVPGIFVTPHNYLGPPPIPPVPVTASPGSLAILALDGLTNMLWPPGYGLGQNKLTSDVKHKGLTIVQDGHDCGYLIPHVQMTLTAANALTPIQIAFSNKKDMFAASTVLMNKLPTATCCPPMMMLYCANPVSLPIAFNATGWGNSVFVGVTWGDIVAGVVAIGPEIILECRIARKEVASTPR